MGDKGVNERFRCVKPRELGQATSSRALNKAWGSTKAENNERFFSTQKEVNFNSKIVIDNTEFSEDGTQTRVSTVPYNVL